MAKFNFLNNQQPSEFFKRLLVEQPKLNLGSNKDFRENFLDIDILDFEDLDIQADIANLYFIPDDSIEEILAYDVLEHFSFTQTSKILHHWFSKLKSKGKIIIRVPDLKLISQKLIHQELPVFEAQRLIYGGQDYIYNFHSAGFTGDSLEGLLRGVGFSEIIQRIYGENEIPISHNVTLVALK
jgi:hypothetical protein